MRLDALRAETCPKDLRNIHGRLHELKGNRKGQLSFDLDHPYRLIFLPNHKRCRLLRMEDWTGAGSPPSRSSESRTHMSNRIHNEYQPDTVTPPWFYIQECGRQ